MIAVKGQSQSGKPIIGKPSERDTSWHGKKVRAGARVWPVGSDTGKYVLYQRLSLQQPGPGYIHTSVELDDEFYKGLTAEQLVTRYIKGRPRSEWMLKKGQRNEPLDLWVYGFAALAYTGWSRRKDSDWQALADKVEPPLFAPADPVVVPQPTAETTIALNQPLPRAPIRPPRPSFVKRW